MKFKFIFLNVLLLFLSCRSQEKDIKYPLVFKSPEGGLMDMIKFRGNYTLNEILTLNKDSTYVYKMCAQLEEGKWRFQNDTIKLYCESRKFHIDSLNYIEKYKKGTICPELPDLWLKKGDGIKNVYNKNVLLGD